MRFSFLIAEVKEGLRRNVTMSVAMILTTAISLTMLGGGLLAVRMADKTQDNFLDKVEVRLYLADDVADADPDCNQQLCKSLLEDLEHTTGVVSTKFISRTDALNEAKEKTFKDQPAMAQLISAMKLPASLKVKMAGPDDYANIYDSFHNRPGVANVRNDKAIVDRLVGLFDGLRNAAFGLAILQAVAALLLIANMVQIAAFTRRAEVSIMRLVGATRWYTQLPFLIEAVAAALAGTVLAVICLVIAKPLVIDQSLKDTSKVIPLIGFDDVFLTAAILAPVGILFAAATAYATLRFYVREQDN
ncbi:MAG: ABC transporter permease [Mycobacteriaceae bacterium]|nr:ABC transporter permease [Mycobacteriaceae bacterium]